MSEKVIKSIIANTTGELKQKSKELPTDIPVAWSYKLQFVKGLSVCLANYYVEYQTFTDAFDYTEYTHPVYRMKKVLDKTMECNTELSKEPVSESQVCLEINKYNADLEKYTQILTIEDLLNVLEPLDDNMQIITPDSNFELKGALTKGIHSLLYSVDEQYIYVVDMF